jgi:hypothetical protein
MDHSYHTQNIIIPPVRFLHNYKYHCSLCKKIDFCDAIANRSVIYFICYDCKTINCCIGCGVLNGCALCNYCLSQPLYA